MRHDIMMRLQERQTIGSTLPCNGFLAQRGRYKIGQKGTRPPADLGIAIAATACKPAHCRILHPAAGV